MRILPVALALTILPAFAQVRDPWDRFVSSLKVARGQQPSFLFIMRGADFAGPCASDERLRQLVNSGELKIQPIQGEEAAALWGRQGWGTEPHWVLLGPKGDLVASGGASPDADDLLWAMRSGGWQPRSELLEAFIREHPDQGEARAQVVLDQLKTQNVPKESDAPAPPRRGGKGGGSTPSPEDVNKDAELSQALTGFTEVDGWAQWSGLDPFLAELESKIQSPSSRLREALDVLRRGVEREIKKCPGDPNLWSAWGRINRLSPGDSPQVMFYGLEPAPRQPWPPPQASKVLAEGFRATADWPGLEHLCTEALGQAASSSLRIIGDPREFRRNLLVAWAPGKVESLLHQHRQDEAFGFISETCAMAGQDWPTVSHAISLIALPEAVDRPAFETALTQPSRAERPLPAHRPLHMVLVGNPVWRAGYESLRNSAALRAWEPARELDWSRSSPHENAVLARQPWAAGPRWVLMRGDEVLDSDTDLPDGRGLAERLRKFGEPYLGELTAFLRTHPDHLEARRLRFDRLVERMPELNWEASLLDDARTLQIAPQARDGWIPADFLWQPASSKALPEIEARIRRWPNDPLGWKAWAEWAALNPRHPHPVSLLTGLGIWKQPGEPGPLPLPVLQQVGRLLKSQGAWEALAEWCEAFWNRGLRDYALALPTPVQSTKRGSHSSDAALELRVALFNPWQEALHQLARDGEWHKVWLELETRNPDLSNWFKGRTY